MNREEWNLEQEQNEQACKRTRIKELEREKKELQGMVAGLRDALWQIQLCEGDDFMGIVLGIAAKARADTAKTSSDFLAGVRAGVWREAKETADGLMCSDCGHPNGLGLGKDCERCLGLDDAQEAFEAKAAESKP